MLYLKHKPHKFYLFHSVLMHVLYQHGFGYIKWLNYLFKVIYSVWMSQTLDYLTEMCGISIPSLIIMVTSRLALYHSGHCNNLSGYN